MQIKIIIGLVILALVVALGWKVNSWRVDANELPRVKAQAAEELALARAETQLVRDQFDVAYSASKGYQRELEELRNVPHEPAPVIRVCKPTTIVRTVERAAAAGPDGPAATEGGVSQTVEFDTGPLYQLADRCDELAAQVRGLQEFELSQQ